MKKHVVLGAALLALALTITGCSAPATNDTATEGAGDSSVESATEAIAATLAYDDTGEPATGSPRVAYLAECATNPYCQVRWEAAQEAAEKFGLEITLFDANFDAATQLTQVQDATQQGFDGYVFSPVTDASGCSNLALLQATDSPVATINSPMCGNADYTEGTVGFVGIQTVSYFQSVIENAFENCNEPCNVVSAGGFLGSDLYNRWSEALHNALETFPEVTLVTEQPANFEPDDAFAVVQDALSAAPNVNLVLSSSDSATFGAEQAIAAAGLQPGEDVKIYSLGGTADAVEKMRAGLWNGSAVLLPHDEAYFGVVQLAKKLTTGEDTTGFANLALAPSIVDGPGTVFITADNADEFVPQW